MVAAVRGAYSSAWLPALSALALRTPPPHDIATARTAAAATATAGAAAGSTSQLTFSSLSTTSSVWAQYVATLEVATMLFVGAGQEVAGAVCAAGTGDVGGAVTRLAACVKALHRCARARVCVCVCVYSLWFGRT